MSTRIGTLQPQARLGHPLRLAGLLAVFVAATLAFAVISVVRDRSDEATVGAVAGTPANIAANTPSELSGGIVAQGVAGGTLANTPSELSGGIVGTRSSWTEASSSGRRGVTPRMSAVAHDGTERPILVNGGVCHQCQ